MIFTRKKDGKQYYLERLITLEEKVPSVNANKGFPLRCAVITDGQTPHFLKFVLKKECEDTGLRAATDAFHTELQFQMHYPGIVYVENLNEYILTTEAEDGKVKEWKPFLSTLSKLEPDYDDMEVKPETGTAGNGMPDWMEENAGNGMSGWKEENAGNGMLNRTEETAGSRMLDRMEEKAGSGMPGWMEEKAGIEVLGLMEEYAGGRSLGDVYAETEQRQPDEILFRHIYKLLNAMCAYYGRWQRDPLLHRDIKPDNIMVGENLKDVTYIDFDIAHVKGSRGTRMRGTFGKGTPGYAHPRQTQAGAGASDIRIDFYGLGMTILYMLCGRDYLMACGFTEEEIDSWDYMERPDACMILYKVKREAVLRSGDPVYQEARYSGLLDLVDLMIADDTENKNVLREPGKLLRQYETYLRSIYGKDYQKLFANETLLSKNKDRSGKTATVQFYSYKKGAQIFTLPENTIQSLTDDQGRSLGILYRTGNRVECMIRGACGEEMKYGSCVKETKHDTDAREMSPRSPQGVVALGTAPWDFETSAGRYRLRLIKMT